MLITYFVCFRCDHIGHLNYKFYNGLTFAYVGVI